MRNAQWRHSTINSKNNKVVDQSLPERSQYLLKALIEKYIDEGAPVGSKTLAQESGLSLSPATVRNVMAELEGRGLIMSPHTSAGRVPTAQGFRFFVDTLISVRPMEGVLLEKMQGELEGYAHSELIASASQMLSGITQMAGVITLPKRELVTLRQVEFLPLSGERVLVILVVNEQDVQNRIIQTDRSYAEGERRQAASFINQHCAGLSLDGVRDCLLKRMQGDKDELGGLMQALLDVSTQAFGGDGKDEGCIVAGKTNLINTAKPEDIEGLRGLFDAFHQKRDILHLLDRCLDADGVQLFIGEESGSCVFDDYSVVTSPYQVEGQVTGVLGVIGPTRMPYDRVISVVDATARLLNAALDQSAKIS